MPILNEKQRVSARIPIHAYQTLIRAAEISGATLNQFLVQAAIEKAQTIIEKDQSNQQMYFLVLLKIHQSLGRNLKML
jgi:uncharacterized protein (DUF1778 family)